MFRSNPTFPSLTENFIFGSIFKQSGYEATIKLNYEDVLQNYLSQLKATGKKSHFMQLEVAKAEVLDVRVVVNAMAEIRKSMFTSRWLCQKNNVWFKLIMFGLKKKEMIKKVSPGSLSSES